MCVRLHLLQEKWKKEILEEQERVRVCYSEIQKLQETVREQEEKIKTLEWLMI